MGTTEEGHHIHLQRLPQGYPRNRLLCSEGFRERRPRIYPPGNPFTTHTEFFFEQNQSGGTFDIQIQIYTISGKLLKTITETQFIEGNRSVGIAWDGRDDYGDKIGKGVYLYRLRVRNQNQETAEEIEKIVIL